MKTEAFLHSLLAISKITAWELLRNGKFGDNYVTDYGSWQALGGTPPSKSDDQG